LAYEIPNQHLVNGKFGMADEINTDINP